MNYFPDFMALAEIALGFGVAFILTVWFFVMGCKARREHHQRGLEIEKLRLRVALLKMDLKECEDYDPAEAPWTTWDELDEDEITIPGDLH